MTASTKGFDPHTNVSFGWVPILSSALDEGSIDPTAGILGATRGILRQAEKHLEIAFHLVTSDQFVPEYHVVPSADGKEEGLRARRSRARCDAGRSTSAAPRRNRLR